MGRAAARGSVGSGGSEDETRAFHTSRRPWSGTRELAAWPALRGLASPLQLPVVWLVSGPTADRPLPPSLGASALLSVCLARVLLLRLLSALSPAVGGTACRCHGAPSHISSDSLILKLCAEASVDGGILPGAMLWVLQSGGRSPLCTSAPLC